ncbi:MAG TPA: hypothetical protein ENI25_04035 [Epsilonproteobacteria bacterium]|nr:hypothetical protein [Campylobacterota bacterium]
MQTPTYTGFHRRASYQSTKKVQTFIRSAIFILTAAVLALLSFPLARLSYFFFLEPSILPIIYAFLVLWVSSIISKMFYILPEWEKMILLRLGKFHSVKGAGFFIIPPFIYSVANILDTRIETQQVEATNTLTSDNVPIKVTAAVEFKVEDARKAAIDVKNYRQSVIWLATEALKNTIGSLNLRNLLSDRERISNDLKQQIDADAEIYGIDVRAVRITDVDAPSTLVEELAVIAREERAAKAKQIQAEAEIQVAEKLSEASQILEKDRFGMRLRELQILNEMSKEESSMVIVYPYGDRVGQEIANANTKIKSQTGKNTPNPVK